MRWPCVRSVAPVVGVVARVRPFALGLSLWAISASAQQASGVADWLWSTPIDYLAPTKDSNIADIRAIGMSAISELAPAARLGPDATALAQLQANAGTEFDNSEADRAGVGSIPGLETLSTAGPPLTRDSYVSTAVSATVLSYRLRAISGMGALGGPQAIQELSSLASTGDLEAIRTAAARTRATLGDLNRDGSVDSRDVAFITGALNSVPNGPWDPRDVNRDGAINVLDARLVVTLCSKPRCTY